MTQRVLVPDMILGVWISTKPFLVRVSLKSMQTPDCRRKMAWLVVVYGRINTQTATHRERNYKTKRDDSSDLLPNHNRCVKTSNAQLLST